MKIEAPSTSVYLQEQLFRKDVFKYIVMYRMYVHLYPELRDFSFKSIDLLREMKSFHSELLFCSYIIRW